MAGYCTVGRHTYTATQIEMLKRVGLTREVCRITTLESPADAVKKAKIAGAEAIVVQGLPLPLLAQLSQLAAAAGLPVYMFKTAPVDIVRTPKECPEDADIVLPSRDGGVRCLRTESLVKVVRVEIKTETVVVRGE